MARAIAEGSIAMAMASSICARIAGSVIEPVRSVRVMPGETPVTRRCGPASWRSPSVIVRTAFLVAA